MARDLAYEAFTAAQAFVEELDRLEEIETETGVEQEWPDTAGPYCGCGVCELREALFAGWPVFLAGVSEELRAAGHDAAADLLAERFPPPAPTGRAAS